MSNFEISVYLKKIPFPFQTIFSLRSLEADTFFSQLQLANISFHEKSNPPPPPPPPIQIMVLPLGFT